MRRSLPLLALVVTLVVGACGGGGGGGGASSAYCKGLKDAADDARSSSTSSSVPISVAFDKAIARISKNAPSEISDDYGVLKKDYAEYFKLSSESDPAKKAASQARLRELATAIQTAGKNITDYNTNVCKFQTSTTAGGVTTSTVKP